MAVFCRLFAEHGFPHKPKDKNNMTFGITGGIGSGKSFVCRLLEKRGYPVYYCDDEAKRIIRTHPAVRKELSALVGPELYDAGGRLVKSVLAAYLCKGGAWARSVDSIVHPRVAEDFCQLARRFDGRAESKPCAVFMECALLFESGFSRLVDHTVLVSAPQQVRLNRVMLRDSVSQTQALAWMSLQMPEEEKARRANTVILNDGAAPLGSQIDDLLKIVPSRQSGRQDSLSAT